MHGSADKVFRYFNDTKGSHMDAFDFVMREYPVEDCSKVFQVAYFGRDREMVIRDIDADTDYCYDPLTDAPFFDLYLEMRTLYEGVRKLACGSSA